VSNFTTVDHYEVLLVVTETRWRGRDKKQLYLSEVVWGELAVPGWTWCWLKWSWRNMNSQSIHELITNGRNKQLPPLQLENHEEQLKITNAFA